MIFKLTFWFGFLCLFFASQRPAAAQRIESESKTDASYERLIGAGASQKWELSGPASKSRQSIQLGGNGASAVLLGQSYESFELQLEAKTSDHGKGYVAFHYDPQGNGYKVAIDNDLQHSVWWRKTGSLLSVRNLTRSMATEEEWFRLNIRVQGSLISVKVNDQLVVAYTQPDQIFRTAENKSARLGKGTIAFVSTSKGNIELRNASIKRLPNVSSDVKTAPTPEILEANDPILKLHQEDFPVLDYHVHLRGVLNKKTAANQSRAFGVNYAVAPSCGQGFPIHDDQGVYNFLDTMKAEPFILAGQTEGREWVDLFSQQALSKLDFVFTDAMTFDDDHGRRTRLWVEQEVHIDDEQAYMDMIVDRTCKVLSEPVAVFVNPFFLPKSMQNRYDFFWTEDRVNKVIDVLAKSGKALEINNRYRIPSKKIIIKAKQAGIKFTFGTNNNTPQLGKMEYAIQMKNECGITKQQMFKPEVKP